MKKSSKKVIRRFGWRLYYTLTAISLIILFGAIYFLYKIRLQNVIIFGIVFSIVYLYGAVYFHKIFSKELNDLDIENSFDRVSNL